MRDFTESEQETLNFLGNFQPTVNVLDCTVKGWITDECGDTYKTYLSSTELRDLAANLNSVAQWLDERANEYERVEKL